MYINNQWDLSRDVMEDPKESEYTKIYTIFELCLLLFDSQQQKNKEGYYERGAVISQYGTYVYTHVYILGYGRGIKSHEMFQYLVILEFEEELMIKM